ncbi:MAG: glucosidase [Chitinophagaceae bacterium]
MAINNSAEQKRLDANATKEIPLEKWGPYLSERQWGTIREDYSENGDAWNYFPHDHARSRAYLWGEDGLAGISDYYQNLCFCIALWNGKDGILKERLFGLTNQEGNHGEDVKELYYYLDNVPTHYYMKYLYKYPQQKFPYNLLIENNKKLSKADPEFEILDTGIFDNDEYFDVVVEYAKKSSEDIFIKIEIVNRFDKAAPLTVLPTLWFYNRWQYGGLKQKPSLSSINETSIKAVHERMGDYYFYFQAADRLLFTENETNFKKLMGKPNMSDFTKDAFHDAVIQDNYELLKDKKQGSKFSPVYNFTIEAHSSKTIFLRLSENVIENPFEDNFESIFLLRKQEADDFYRQLLPLKLSPDLFNIQRQAFAGLLWNKQYYHYDAERWLNTGDGITPVTASRKKGRNSAWKHLKNQDVISMPDKWEYPWYAAWDLAFHCVPLAMIDPVFAKNQLVLIMREWYMNPEGQVPAYEWNFSDVNPPVHAWAALQVYHIEKRMKGEGDIYFLKKIFQKLIINFTWWINRKDENGNNIFEGGFLGLDNIGVFNRNMRLASGELLEQADGTSWMGMYALTMMDIAIEIAKVDLSFEDTATKFYEHFILIAEALNEQGLWNEEDGFFYDTLSIAGCDPFQIKVRSIVGLTSVFAVSIVEKKHLQILPDFTKRIIWFRNYRMAHKKFINSEWLSENDPILISMIHKKKLTELMEYVLDEKEFLSDGGVRALSACYRKNPYNINLGGEDYSIQYDPGDATTGMFGGNSNWRGPVWIPMNYLLIVAIEKNYQYYGDSLKVEFPGGSGKWVNLHEIAIELTNRILSIFKKDVHGNRPVFSRYNYFYSKPGNEDLVLFHEYFHGDSRMGLGASHQTGWTALIANLIEGMVEA